MLIKHIDEIVKNGQFDIDNDGDVPVYLVEITGFIEEKGLVEWEIVGECDVPRNQLHYDDITDGSNTLSGTWSSFYCNKYEFGDNSPFKGTDSLFSNDRPNFGGVAKLTSYLRYSDAFIKWLNSFDSKTAIKIENEIEFFENKKRYSNYTKRTFKSPWHNFNTPDGRRWALPVLCNLSNGDRIVFGLLKTDDGDWDELKHLNVDIDKSLELMTFLRTPSRLKNNREKTLDLFQTGSGLGRNAFKKEYKKIGLTNIENLPESEFIRLMGCITTSDRDDILYVWANKCSYKVYVAPNPDKSELIYLPEGDVKFSSLVKFSKEISQRRTNYFEQKKQKKNKSEDNEGLIKEKLPIIPTPKYANVSMYLINKEGSQKEKIIIQHIFPSISLDYFARLDAELLSNNTENTIVGYMKKALTAQDRGTPSTYIYWTKVFTSVLQKNYISAYELFYNFQRFCKAFTGKDLVENGKARDYFFVIGKLKRLQHIVELAQEGKSIDKITDKLDKIEKNIITSKGVFTMTKKEMPKVKEVIGEVYTDLRDYQQEKIIAFMKKSWTGVPNEDFTLFIRGGLVGILLNELTWLVKSEGRSFSVTQGRHPSTLRGKDIQRVCEKGIGLLMGVDKAHLFNGKAALFIQSCLEESRKDSFNSGLIMGLVFYYKTTTEEETKND
ncbi:MAG: hypothetical protein U9O87_05155 [Verrucomicrobiota bacterium]|nr:hypothetical protein [Verrucomicrobiota bacterium]